ncbi:MAG TPA: hypothetical protein VE243_06505, partial [Candidatus Acidoferrum sp.]|nr:hypothetical protein [Candidatus Acidoferrum sp.]
MAGTTLMYQRRKKRLVFLGCLVVEKSKQRADPANGVTHEQFRRGSNHHRISARRPPLATAD